MKKLHTTVWISCIVILILISSCTLIPTTQAPAIPSQSTTPAETSTAQTDTPAVSSPTGTFTVPTATEFTEVPSKESPTPTFSATENAIPTTPIILPATQPPSVFTTDIVVYLPNLSGNFTVPARTNFTIRDMGTDGVQNSCRVSRTGFSRRVTLPVNAVSVAFWLEAGTYTLNCGRPNQNATIVSRIR